MKNNITCMSIIYSCIISLPLLSLWLAFFFLFWFFFFYLLIFRFCFFNFGFRFCFFFGFWFSFLGLHETKTRTTWTLEQELHSLSSPLSCCGKSNRDSSFVQHICHQQRDLTEFSKFQAGQETEI